MNKQRIEYGLFRAVAGAVRRLPEPAATGLMQALALAAQDLLGWRRRETKARLRQVFPLQTARERERIRRGALRHLGRTLTELIRPPKDFDQRVDGLEETFEAFRRARQRGKGVLLVIVHSGNWDLAGVRTAREGFPLCFIARQQKNDQLYHELIRAREEGGGTVLDRDDPKLLRKTLSFLAENGIVAILIDIRARKPGSPWHFLGQPAWVSNGLGLLAAKSGAEVVPVYLGRNGPRHHQWKPFPATRLDPKSSREQRDALLQDCLDALGGEVKKNPESYFWFNKRWVLETKQPDSHGSRH